MSRFIETIKILDGVPQHLQYHNRRFNHTRKNFFRMPSGIDLSEILKAQYQQVLSGKVKATIEYDREIQEIRFQNYRPKKVTSLRLVEAEDLEYSYKYANRSEINKLLDQHGDADDIIICKNGYLTDSSYSNLAFYDGYKWFTPLQPLLKGTCRQRLLEENKITEIPVKINDLKNFQICSLINAMLDLEESYVNVNKISI